MKSTTSFTRLPVSKGMFLLVDKARYYLIVDELEIYFQASGSKTIDVIPLMRYLNEKLDFKGDDIKLAVAAVVEDENSRYYFNSGYRQYTAYEKTLLIEIDGQICTEIIRRKILTEEDLENFLSEIETYPVG
jgi:hypothetical protein